VVLERTGAAYVTRMAVSNTKTGWLVLDRRQVSRCRVDKLREKAAAVATANGVEFEDRTGDSA
jgi:hypothetical protein